MVTTSRRAIQTIFVCCSQWQITTCIDCMILKGYRAGVLAPMADIAVPLAIKVSALLDRIYCASSTDNRDTVRSRYVEQRIPKLTKHPLNLPRVYPGIHQRSQKKGPCGISRHRSPTSPGDEVRLSLQCLFILTKALGI